MCIRDRIKFAFVFEITLKVFWDATREESVLVRFNRPNNKIIFHNEPLIATTNATKSATKNQRGSLWSENQRCNELLVLLVEFSILETRGIVPEKVTEPLTPTLKIWNPWRINWIWTGGLESQHRSNVYYFVKYRQIIQSSPKDLFSHSYFFYIFHFFTYKIFRFFHS